MKGQLFPQENNFKQCINRDIGSNGTCGLSIKIFTLLGIPEVRCSIGYEEATKKGKA